MPKTLKITRTSAGLADALMDEFDALINGDSTPQNARAKASLVGGIIKITKLEMDKARFVADTRSKVSAIQRLPALEMGL